MYEILKEIEGLKEQLNSINEILAEGHNHALYIARVEVAAALEIEQQKLVGLYV